MEAGEGSYSQAEKDGLGYGWHGISIFQNLYHLMIVLAPRHGSGDGFCKVAR